MKRNFLLVLLSGVLRYLATSCTENQRARKFGGSYSVDLPENSELVNATWKETDLWLLVQDSTTKELKLIEYSNWGILSGEVKIK